MAIFMFRNIFRKRKLVLVISALLAAFAIYVSLGSFSKTKISFNKDVRPIINSKCISCHGGVKQSGGFNLIFRDLALGKTKSGKIAIVPGNPGASELMKRISSHDEDYRMPKGKAPLTEEEIGIFRNWIAQGAHWENHWSFIKPGNVSVPDVDDEEFVKNDIDRFILEKQEEQDLDHSPEADKATLVRRLSLDLTGLPPTIAQLDSFLNDKSGDAYEKLVDRLLVSPAYGERWAALWLDLSRFADTKGYEADDSRNIWRYRDYLIRSFNEDKPYDQFTVEQLAGDMMPSPSEDQVIATAFNRNTMSNDEGGTDNEEFRTAAVIDRVNTTFEVWQGITISCVQCHSHPYDPIRQKEYYNVLAFLNNTRDNDVWEESPTFITSADYKEESAEAIIRRINQLRGDKNGVPESPKDKRRKYLPLFLSAKDFDTASHIEFIHPTATLLSPEAFIGFENVDLTGIDTIGAYYAALNGGTLEARIGSPSGPVVINYNLNTTYGGFHYIKGGLARPLKGDHNLYFVLKPSPQGPGEVTLRDFRFFISKKHKDNSKNKKEIDSLQRELLKAINPDGTPVMQELSGDRKRPTHVFVRGNWTDKGEQVEPGVPEILNPLPKGAPGNRLGMALWLVSEDNPLTSRVAVNRLWEQLFGYGLVETLEDFGSQGNPPTHPELLDWLAVKYMRDYHWSTKKLLKLIVMSGTYRQSSAVTADHLEKDQRNRYLARAPRIRLNAEQVRDQALAVGGILSYKMYGPSVMPPQPPGVWQSPYNAKQWKTSAGDDAFRRGIYTYIKRTSPYPNMITFDGPSREFTLARRIRTNTPLQALAILNDTVYVQAAVGLAKRMIAEGGRDVESRIRTGYRIALAHYPDRSPLDKLVALHNKALAFYQADHEKAMTMTGTKENATELAALTMVASAIINQDEFINKE